MSYVKSEQQISELRDIFSPARYVGETITVEYETSPDFIRSVLPPCFEFSGQCNGLVMMGRAATDRGVYEFTSVTIPARFRDIAGKYNLTLLISPDMAVSVARDRWGEPKKLGNTRLHFEGDRFTGYGERNGVDLVEISAKFDRELEPARAEGTTLELKAIMGANGVTLEYDPLVIVDRRRHNHLVRRGGEATLKFRGTATDPVDTIPVHAVKSCTYTYGAMETVSCDLYPMQGRDEYLPYVMGRSYDLLPGDYRATFKPMAPFGSG